MTFRYDDARAAVIGAPESSIRLYYSYSRDAWHTPYGTVTLDTERKTLRVPYTLAPGMWMAAIWNEWKPTGDGNSDAVSWTGGFTPNGADAVANFLGAITGPSTVTWNGPATLGRINFTNAKSYTLAGADVLRLESSAGKAKINVLAGNHQISAPLFLANGVEINVAGIADQLTISGRMEGSGGLTKSGPGTLMLSGTGTYGGETFVQAGTLKIAGAGALPPGSELTIAGTGTVILASGLGAGADSVQSVPEPAAVTLLAVAILVGVMGVWCQKRAYAGGAHPQCATSPRP